MLRLSKLAPSCAEQCAPIACDPSTKLRLRLHNLGSVTVTTCTVVILLLLRSGSRTGRVHGFWARLRLFCNRVCYAYDNSHSTQDLAPQQLALSREALLLPSFVQRGLGLDLYCLDLDHAQNPWLTRILCTVRATERSLLLQFCLDEYG